MKKLTASFLTIAILFFGCSQHHIDKAQEVNPVIGDISFVTKFGHHPDKETDNDLRIKTHLEYVEERLRARDITGLPFNLKQNREHLLDLLHNYRLAGNFPKNYDHPGVRKPCFIDKDNAICAVGYLVEQTSGRQVAEQINSLYKYKELMAMNDKVLDDWIKESGLTKEECAMIQPSYGPPPPDPVVSSNYISKGYGISSAAFGGLNLSLSGINALQIFRGSKSKVVPVAGLISGIGQVALGISNFPDNQINGSSNESKKALSMVNIGIGTSTIVLSAWNLITNRNVKERATSWNIYGYPTQNGNTALAFSLTRKF